MTRKIFLCLASKLLGLAIVLFGVLRLKPSMAGNLLTGSRSEVAKSEDASVKIKSSRYVIPCNSDSVSVKKALNSRCSSDDNGNPEKFHWGAFDSSAKISMDQLKAFLDLVKIPRLTSWRIDIQTDGNMLTLVMDRQLTGVQREWVMVECGMLLQSICLMASARGIGIQIVNLGRDGKKMSKTDHAIIKMRSGASHPCYGGSFWTVSPPTNPNRSQQYDLPNPNRDGTIPLIDAMKQLKASNKGAKSSTDENIGQLLWAARGRTPHRYLTKKWGLTIPTWGGRQDLSEVYLLAGSKLYEYQNWQGNQPVHRISVKGNIEADAQTFFSRLSSYNCFIWLVRNDRYARSSWEIGCQLFNLLLQAHALNLSYTVILPDDDQIESFKRLALKTLSALFCLDSQFYM